jgi:hypothetical protein
MKNPVSSGAQLARLKTLLGWAIVHAPLSFASIPYRQVEKTTKKGKSAPENSQNRPEPVQNGQKTEKPPPQNKHFQATCRNSYSSISPPTFPPTSPAIFHTRQCRLPISLLVHPSPPKSPSNSCPDREGNIEVSFQSTTWTLNVKPACNYLK